jgi:glycerate kinase
MKFVIAPDKFKGSLSGIEFCNAAEKGIKNIFPNATIVKIPLADGGDGTIDALQHTLQGEKTEVLVNNPLSNPVLATYLYVSKTQTAIIEMAEASGLRLLKTSELNCMQSSSFGTGELILDAINRGAKNIILGIGGSATNDAGIGIATALGFRFLDKKKQVITPTGENLNQISEIDDSQVNPLLKNTSIQVACDVSNPLHGKNGAAHIYSKQKGASEKEIILLDEGLLHFSNIIQNTYTIDCNIISGAGAAGGLGAGSVIFLNAKLQSGIELIKTITKFDTIIQNADWIITGEGKLDNQTLSGKTIAGILKSAHKKNIPVAAFCGAVTISKKEQNSLGLKYVSAISEDSNDLQHAMQQSSKNLELSISNFCRSLK